MDSLFSVDAGLLVLRVGFAAVMIAHGLPKIKGVPGVAGFFKQINIPAPTFFAWVVALLETVGAGAIALGAGTRYLAAMNIVTMLVAITRVKMGMGKKGFSGDNGWELEFSLLVIALGLTLAGAGAYSLDAALGW